MFRLRTSTQADSDEIYELWHRSVKATHDFLSAADFLAISRLVKFNYVPVTAFTVAEKDGQIVGFMAMTNDLIDALFIDPDHFGKGLGRIFVEEAAKKVGENGVLKVEVNEQNTGAVRFYRALGFHSTARSETDGHGRPYPILTLERP